MRTAMSDRAFDLPPLELLVAFESTAADLRRAVVAGYSTYSKR